MLKKRSLIFPRPMKTSLEIQASASWAVLHKIVAFIVRDFKVETSYKLSFILRALNSMVTLIFFFFLSKMVFNPMMPGLAKYGGDYFSFVLIGVAFHRYMELSTRMFANSIGMAQVTGCLEVMLGTRTRPTTLVLLSSFYGLISTTVHLLLIFTVAVTLLGFDFGNANGTAALVVFLFSIVTFMGFGILAATSIVLFKRGDPVTWLFSVLGVVLGGAYFPLEVMPDWFEQVAWLNPIAQSLDAFRLTLLKGYSLSMVSEPLWFLACTGAVLFPASLALFAAAVRKGRRDGTLMHY